MDERVELMKASLALIDTPAVIVSDHGEVEWQNHAAEPLKLEIGYSASCSVEDFDRMFVSWGYHREYRVDVSVLGKPMVLTVSRIGPVNLLLFTEAEKKADGTVQTVLLSLFHGMESLAGDMIRAIRSIAEDMEELNDAALDRKLGEVTRSCYRLVRSATDMAELGHLEAEDQNVLPREVPLRAYFERLAEKEAAILREFPVRLKTVFGIKDTQKGNVDPVIAEKVIAILLGNAVKYGEKGSEIELEIASDKRAVRIMVTNRGEGIDGDTLSTAFSRYLQTPDFDDLHTGAGMGLAVVRELTQRHGGATLIRSGAGSVTVVASLDITMEKAANAHAPLLPTAQRFDLSLVELSEVLPAETFLSYAVEV